MTKLSRLLSQITVLYLPIILSPPFFSVSETSKGTGHLAFGENKFMFFFTKNKNGEEESKTVNISDFKEIGDRASHFEYHEPSELVTTFS